MTQTTDAPATTAHTPGPWTVKDSRHKQHICANWHGDETVIATTTDTYGAVFEAENLANARLMAAAPDLLEACKMALYLVGGFSPSTAGLMAAAIEKATGETA